MRTLYWGPDNANLPVHIALEELGLDHALHRVDRAGGEARSATYLAIAPTGLIPAMTDGDQTLFETGALLVHLALAAGRLGPDGPGMDSPLRGRFLSWVFFLSNTVHADMRLSFRTGPIAGPDREAAAQRAFGARLAGHFALLEAEAAQSGGPFLMGGSLTLADIYAACLARWCRIFPEPSAPLVPDFAHPHLLAAFARLEDRPATRRALAAEGIGDAAPFSAPG